MSERTPEPVHNLPAFTVSELSASLKRTVEDAFGYVRVRGEISQPKVATSGHCYLRLKDETAVLDGVIWRGSMGKLKIKLEEGMDVIATGRITTYPGKSSYQIELAVSKVLRGDMAKALGELRDQYDSGADPAVVLSDLAEFTHFVTRVKVVPAVADDLSLAEAERTRGRAFAAALSMRVLSRAWRSEEHTSELQSQ